MELDIVLKNIYDNQVSYIRNKNIELERVYFTKNKSNIPICELMEGTSYEDHFVSFKNMVKNSTDYKLNKIFTLLEEYFLFSYGHDMMFKKKLEADLYVSVPIEDFIYPKLVNYVKEKYNDISIMKENPNLDKNIKGIESRIHTFIELESLLYLLYCNDFKYPNGWEKLYPDTNIEIINLLNNLKITIGDFLNALIDFKCKIMSEIFSEITEPILREKYLERVEALKNEKREETRSFAHINLPVTYFLNHSNTSHILEDNMDNNNKKLLLPN